MSPCLTQATWLPQDLKYGPQFRVATRFKGAHADLKAQLRSDDRPEALVYQPRPQGTGSSQGIMDWKVGGWVNTSPSTSFLCLHACIPR